MLLYSAVLLQLSHSLLNTSVRSCHSSAQNCALSYISLSGKMKIPPPCQSSCQNVNLPVTLVTLFLGFYWPHLHWSLATLGCSSLVRALCWYFYCHLHMVLLSHMASSPTSKSSSQFLLWPLYFKRQPPDIFLILPTPSSFFFSLAVLILLMC